MNSLKNWLILLLWIILLKVVFSMIYWHTWDAWNFYIINTLYVSHDIPYYLWWALPAGSLWVFSGTVLSSIVQTFDIVDPIYGATIVAHLIAVLGDLLLILVLYRIFNNFMIRSKSIPAVLLIFTAPWLWMVSAYYNQFDVYLLIFSIISIYFFTKDRYYLAALSTSVGFTIKYLTWLLIPLFIAMLFIDKRLSLRKKIQILSISISIFIITLLVSYVPLLVTVMDIGIVDIVKLTYNNYLVNLVWVTKWALNEISGTTYAIYNLMQFYLDLSSYRNTTSLDWIASLLKVYKVGIFLFLYSVGLGYFSYRFSRLKSDSPILKFKLLLLFYSYSSFSFLIFYDDFNIHRYMHFMIPLLIIWILNNSPRLVYTNILAWMVVFLSVILFRPIEQFLIWLQISLFSVVSTFFIYSIILIMALSRYLERKKLSLINLVLILFFPVIIWCVNMLWLHWNYHILSIAFWYILIASSLFYAFIHE